MYATVTTCRDWPPRARPGILHLMDIRADGWTDVTNAVDFAWFVAAHLEIGCVLIYDDRFPRGPIPFREFASKYLTQLWPEAELLAAFREANRQRSRKIP